MVANRYIDLGEWHHRRGSPLRPPACRVPRLRTADDQDQAYDDWIVQVADYLEGLDQEARQELGRLPQAGNLLRSIAAAAPGFWWDAQKIDRLVDAREQVQDQLDDHVNTISVSLAVGQQYLDAMLESADRIRSEPAQQAANRILDITHADEVTA